MLNTLCTANREAILNRLDEPVFKAGPKPMAMLTEFDIHHRLESCVFVCCYEFLSEHSKVVSFQKGIN